MTELELPIKRSVSFRTMCFYGVFANILLLMGISQLPNESSYFNGMAIKAFATIITIYVWRYVLCSAKLTPKQMSLAYFALLISILPYIYFAVFFINEPFGEPLSKWIGDPIWVFAIPTISFLIFDLKNIWCKPLGFFIRSIIEIIIIFTIWSSIWLTLQLSFEWVWI